MVRLLLTIAVAAALGIAGGYAQYSAAFGRVEERLASFVADKGSTSPVSLPTQVEKEKPAAGAYPKVEVVGGTNYNFGTMQQGSSRKHGFVFRNIGQAPLTLAVAGSSCRCTIGTLADSSLEPGEETEVTLDWKATGVLDEFSQTATITTNDPEHGQVLLSVKGIVTRTILVEPSAFNLGDISVTEGMTKKAYVFGYADVPLDVTKVKWSDERTAAMVDVEVKPMEIDSATFPNHAKANGAAEVTLKLKPGLPMGTLESRVVLDTNIKNVANVEINVTGKVVGDVQVLAGPSYEPERNLLNIGIVDRAVGTTVRFHLSAQGSLRNDLKFEVGDVLPAETLQVTIGEPKQQNNRTLYPVTCTVPPNAPIAMFPGSSPTNFGKIILKTNNPNIPDIRVNLRLIVQ